MCDYSLMGVPNRLAREGEELVVHRLSTGSQALALALASSSDLRRVSNPLPAWLSGFWFSRAPEDTISAVCIPPGAQLLLQDIPIDLERSLKVDWAEEVTFTQLTSAVDTYRDAVRFNNGNEIYLQGLREGQRVKVLHLSLANDAVRRERTESLF